MDFSENGFAGALYSVYIGMCKWSKVFFSSKIVADPNFIFLYIRLLDGKFILYFGYVLNNLAIFDT